MHRKFFVLVFIFVAVFAAACSKSSNNNATTNQQGTSPNPDNKPPQPINASPNQITDRNAPPQVLTVSVPKVNLTAGGTTDALITLKIVDGYHVNANPPSESNLIPTKVELKAANGISAEKPVYPPGASRKFPFSQKPVAVYDNQVTIQVKLRAAANATQGPHLITGTLNYQACNNEFCFPPTKMDLMIPANVN